MRYSILLFFVLIVSGCSLTPQVYDNNEYELLAKLETSVSLIQENCNDSNIVKKFIPQLEYDARLLHTYTFYIPKNSEVYDMVNILKNDVLEFKKQYQNGKESPLYCRLKTRLFLEKVRTTLKSVANKKRI